jgi:hypothetical protein
MPCLFPIPKMKFYVKVSQEVIVFQPFFPLNIKDVKVASLMGFRLALSGFEMNLIVKNLKKVNAPGIVRKGS